MKIRFNKKRKIIMSILLVYISLILIELPIYKYLVNKRIDKYIEAQGLKNEEVISDSGLYRLYYFPTGGNILNRNIEYKKNPETIYVYSIGGRIYSFLPFYNVLTFNSMIKNDTDHYEGILFEVRDKANFAFKDEEFIDGKYVSEGELDSNGKLLIEIPWKKNK